MKFIRFTAAALAAASLSLGYASAETLSGTAEKAVAEARKSYEGDGHLLGREAYRAVHWSMFTAANLADPTFSNHIEVEGDFAGADPEEAAALAARIVLEEFYGEAGAAASGDLPALGNAESMAAASAAVKAVLAALDRGIDEDAGYRPFTRPGVWVPTSTPIGLGARQGRPIVLESREELFPGGPPKLGSKQWADDYNEVKAIGGKDSAARTEQQTFEARFWIQKDYQPLIEQIAEMRDLSTLEVARLYTVMAITTADAGLTTFAAKHHFNFWRPVTAIRNGESDRRRDTEPDRFWSPLLTSPMHPEYPCAHCSFGGAVSAVLSSEVPLRDGETVKVYSEDRPNEVVVLDDLKDFATRMSMSRIYGGVHYRTSNDHAEEIGAKTAERVLARFQRLEAEK